MPDHANEIVAALPFNRHVGLSPRPDGKLQMPDDARLLNHVGTVHAGALFALGEAASGAALLDALGAKLAGAVPIVRTARIEFLRPAHGVLVGAGSLDGEAALARLVADGKADVEVGVDLSDELGTVVARVIVTWALRRPRS